jgi:hypothetical protein
MRHRGSLIVLGSLLGLLSATAEAEPPSPAPKTSAARVSGQSDAVVIMYQLDDIQTACDDAVIERYDQELTPVQAKQKLTRLLSQWLDLYLQLRKGRRELLGKHELKFLNKMEADRKPFIDRHADYLLGDTQAVHAGELLLLERIKDSVAEYAAQRSVPTGSPAPSAAPASPSAPAEPPRITITTPAPSRTEEKTR